MECYIRFLKIILILPWILTHASFHSRFVLTQLKSQWYAIYDSVFDCILLSWPFKQSCTIYLTFPMFNSTPTVYKTHHSSKDPFYLCAMFNYDNLQTRNVCFSCNLVNDNAIRRGYVVLQGFWWVCIVCCQGCLEVHCWKIRFN